jgi:predicted nicotinamide N-methyase
MEAATATHAQGHRCRHLPASVRAIRHVEQTTQLRLLQLLDNATYQVPVTRTLEDSDIKRSTVWRFRV